MMPPSIIFRYFATMNYKLTKKEVTVDAGEFVRRYRDVERFAAFCAQCPSHGNSWGCPPFSFNPVTMSDGFKTVTLMGATIAFDDMTIAACRGAKAKSRQVATQAMKEVWSTLLPELMERESQLPGSRCFTFRCSLCPEGCTRPEGKPCRHPDMLRYSLESVGFDVSAAAHDLLSVDLEWSDDGSLSKHITLVTALMCP